VWCFGLFWALALLCFPGCSCVGAAQRLCRQEFFANDFVCRATPSHAQDSVFSSHDFDLSSSTVSVCWSPFSLRLGAPPGTAGPRPPTGAVSRPARLARAARARVDLLCRSTNAPGFPLILLEPGLCPVNPSLSVGLPALIQFPLE
jgi:hypothetical protein